MRLVTLDSRETGGRPAVWLPSGDILDLTVLPAGLSGSHWRPQSVVSVLAEGEEGAARIRRLIRDVNDAGDAQLENWRVEGRLLPRAGTQLLTPVRRPGLLLMVPGMDEWQTRAYVKNPNAALGPDAAVNLPHAGVDELYGQCLLGIVLGRTLFRATPAQALQAIAALTLVADLGTARAGPDGSTSRQFPGACVIGPALVTLDEFEEGTDWSPGVRINQQSLGPAVPGLDRAAVAQRLARLSADYALRPGDIVGLPTGLAEFTLGAGDRVTLSFGDGLVLDFSIQAQDPRSRPVQGGVVRNPP